MDKNEKRAGTPQELKLLYGLDIGTLANLRSRRQGPRFFKVGRRVFYFLTDVEEWLTRNPILTTDSMDSNRE